MIGFSHECLSLTNCQYLVVSIPNDINVMYITEPLFPFIFRAKYLFTPCPVVHPLFYSKGGQDISFKFLSFNLPSNLMKEIIQKTSEQIPKVFHQYELAEKTIQPIIQHTSIGNKCIQFNIFYTKTIVCSLQSLLLY